MASGPSKPDGVAFRRYLRAASELVGSAGHSELIRSAIRQYAVAGVAYDRAATAWAEAVRRREVGRGRRPSERRVERLARRLGLADATLKDALARLVELASGYRKPVATPAEILAKVVRDRE
jgi:hypothetical protein